MHHTLVLFTTALGVGLAATACSGTKRGTAAYRTDTQQVLATRDAQLRSCYDAALASDATLAGTVTVRFVIQKKTGTFQNVTVDPATDGAPEPLVACVIQAVEGLALQPGDANEGQATFTYEFKPASPA